MTDLDYPVTLREKLAGLAEETGRPVNPVYAQPGFLDPTAREKLPESGSDRVDSISVEERTIVSAISVHMIESFYGTLTPLGMLLVLGAMLDFLTIERADPVYGEFADPWREVEQLPAETREQLGRAAWHIGEAVKAAGLAEILHEPSA